MTQQKDLVDAFEAFIVGCKADGIWDPIKACCLMVGWNNLNGALIPLKGAAPTNFNFVSGDYDRATGLVGDGSTKYLDSNRNNNADPQDSKHLAVYQTSLATLTCLLLGTSNVPGRSALISATFSQGAFASPINTGSYSFQNGNTVGFFGAVRTSSTEKSARVGGTDFPETTTSQTPADQSLGVFASANGQTLTDARLSFYSIGESVDLAKLDARVSTLMTAIGAAIP